MREHDDNSTFDARYPPDTTLPRSDEYSDAWLEGCYGRSEHDLAIVQAANPKCVWSIVSGDDGLYAVSGFRTVNWENYFISANPRPDVEDDFEEYQLLIDEEETEEDEILRQIIEEGE